MHSLRARRYTEVVPRRSTGFPQADAGDDFLRVRRRQVLSRLASRLRGEPDDVSMVLPFDEVVAALGRAGERPLGIQTIRLETIVGTVDKAKAFDRQFRPTSATVRERWERIDAAHRRGEAMPPISVYRIGDMHFVRDGHHRVSVAHALGLRVIDAAVTLVRTKLSAHGIRGRGDLLVKDLQRMFEDRVPLPTEAQEALTVADPWSWALLGEAVEAWGFRYLQQEHTFLLRAEVAAAWYRLEYRPVVEMLRTTDLIGANTEAEAYLRVARERYRLVRTHAWSEDIVARLRADAGDGSPTRDRQARPHGRRGSGSR